ncbi:MAG TPA: GAF domain-containing protein [Candidatus Dormibacteraeota bacterium]
MAAVKPNLRLDFDDLPGALIVYDAGGRVTSANPAAAALLGVSVEDLIGSRAERAEWFLTDAAGWPAADNLHPALAAMRSRQPEREVVARVTRPDGSETWIQVDALPVLTDTGAVSHVVLTLTDISRIITDARLPRPTYGAQAVVEVTEQLAGARLDPEAILKTVTATLSRLRSGTWVATLMNKDPRTVRIVAASDADPQIAEYVESLQLSGGESMTTPISTRVIESGEPLLIPNVPYEDFMGSLSDEIREYVERNRPPISSPVRYMGVLVVPMRARGSTVGTLGLFERRGSNPLTERDIAWVQDIADRTGVAADNAQLYVDAIHRLERLTALRSVRLAISGSRELRLTLQVILDQATAGLGVDAADILLVDDKDGMLEAVATTGFQSTSIPDYRLPVDEGLPGRAFLGKRIETVTALGAFSQFRRRSLFAREGFKAYGAVPLIAGGKLAGVLEVFHRSQLQPDQEWLEFLDAIGSDAAIAIDNSSMHSRLQQAGPEGARRVRMPAPDLSRLETAILGYVVEGLSNRVIAEKVHLSQHTVKFHVGQLLDKLGVSNRTELARKATQEGWF